MYNTYNSGMGQFGYNTGYNPYNQYMPSNIQKTEIDWVNGIEGVRAFPMGANSSKLLADSTAPIVWFVTTDSAGVKSPVAFDIKQHEETQVDYNSFEERLKRLEDAFVNGKPDNAASKSKKSD